MPLHLDPYLVRDPVPDGDDIVGSDPRIEVPQILDVALDIPVGERTGGGPRRIIVAILGLDLPRSSQE